ncbi:MAG: hypothetical protein DRP35_09735 [Candidatus Zixiibacteriota bacterium]|nr:MAG: hypothetical protein DRP35_09735 [candidate division Zixibacteria bacterium]
MKFFINCFLVLLVLTNFTKAEVITLEDALTISITESSRGSIIEGNLEVAEKQYYAKKVNFYVPKVFLNGSLPSYSVNESFRFFGGATQKSLFKTTDFEYRSNIQLDQSLITGGNLKVTANLKRSDAKYPNTALSDTEINELTQQGFFDFEFVQPILQPSSAKYELNNKHDDLEIARINQLEEIASLKEEVINAYIGVLKMSLEEKISEAKVETAKLNVEIDSLKFIDEVISEEMWLESSSKYLDEELNQFDIVNQSEAKQRSLRALLDIDNDKKFDVMIPEKSEPISESEKNRLISNWEASAPLKKAKHIYEKEKRAADFQAGSHGLTGNLTANYSMGRGTVEFDDTPNDDIKTNSWGLAVNLTYPLFDGGSSKAAVNAAYITSEKSRLEFESVRKAIKAEIRDLVNNIGISHRKLEILEKQIGLAKNKMDIAKYRYDDGQISKMSYNDSYIFFLEARVKYLEEIKKNLIDRAKLESKYIG